MSDYLPPQPERSPLLTFLRRLLSWALRWTVLGTVLGAALFWMQNFDDSVAITLVRRAIKGAVLGALVGTAGGVLDSWRRVRRTQPVWIVGVLVLGVDLGLLFWLLLSFWYWP